MALRHLRTIAEYNLRTLRTSPLAELSGSLGDLGTLLPLMIALALQGSIDLPATLVFSGLTNIFTGAWYGLPLPVQPVMKAIAAISISQGFSQQETMAAGLTMGISVFILSITGLFSLLNKIVPVPVVKGIQVGAGLALVISAGGSMIKPLDWISPSWDNRLIAMAAFLIFAALTPRFPFALVVFTTGTVVSAVVLAHTSHERHLAGIWRPSVSVPDGNAWRVGAIDAAIPQLPLTTLNSVLAVVSLASSLFPTVVPSTPSTTSVGFSVAIANLTGCWFGAMPVCHGSGGLAGQYRFGARSGASIIILGTVKLLLGLLAGDAIIPLLQRFPKSLLGIMVLAAGVELAKVGQSVSESKDLWDRAEAEHSDDCTTSETTNTLERERQERWMVLLVTVAGCLACKNDFVGFVAGMAWHWALRIPDWMTRMRDGRITLDRGQGSSGFLGRGPD